MYIYICYYLGMWLLTVFWLRMDVFTTYTQASELQAITAPQLISTIHKSPRHTLSIFQPAVSSPAVPWQRFLTVHILSFPRSGPIFTASRADLNWLCPLLITSGHGPYRKHRSSVVCFRVHCGGNIFTELLPINGSSADYESTVLLLLSYIRGVT
jgi:hypothetical protein